MNAIFLPTQELDPLPDVADAGRFLVERLQQTASQAPQLAPVIQQLAVRRLALHAALRFARFWFFVRALALVCFVTKSFRSLSAATIPAVMRRSLALEVTVQLCHGQTPSSPFCAPVATVSMHLEPAAERQSKR